MKPELALNELAVGLETNLLPEIPLAKEEKKSCNERVGKGVPEHKFHVSVMLLKKKIWINMASMKSLPVATVFYFRNSYE